jgi:hypothetical protein
MFQKRYLLRLRVPSDPNAAITYLRDLVRNDKAVPLWTTLRSKLSRSNISITDYFDNQRTGIQYDLSLNVPDPNQLSGGENNEGLVIDPTLCSFGQWRRIVYACPILGLHFTNDFLDAYVDWNIGACH